MISVISGRKFHLGILRGKFDLEWCSITEPYPIALFTTEEWQLGGETGGDGGGKGGGGCRIGGRGGGTGEDGEGEVLYRKLSLTVSVRQLSVRREVNSTLV